MQLFYDPGSDVFLVPDVIGNLTAGAVRVVQGKPLHYFDRAIKTHLKVHGKSTTCLTVRLARALMIKLSPDLSTPA